MDVEDTAEIPASITVSYSDYERETLHAAEAALGTSVDPFPEGKTVERIQTVRLDPIEDRDPLPTILDAIHTTTREDEEQNLAGRQQSLAGSLLLHPKSVAVGLGYVDPVSFFVTFGQAFKA